MNLSWIRPFKLLIVLFPLAVEPAFADSGTSSGICPTLQVDAKSDGTQIRKALSQYLVPVIAPNSAPTATANAPVHMAEEQATKGAVTLSVGGTAAAGGSDQGLNAADQFLLSRAQAEVTPWLANAIVTRYCSDSADVSTHSEDQPVPSPAQQSKDGPAYALNGTSTTTAGTAVDIALEGGVAKGTPIFSIVAAVPPPPAAPGAGAACKPPEIRTLHGCLSQKPDSPTDFSYLPDSGFSGVDRFEFGVSDGSNKSPNATVEIQVTGNYAATAFPNTCETLRGYKYDSSAWPTKSTLQDAMRSDLERLPICSTNGWLNGKVAHLYDAMSGSASGEAAELLLFASFSDNLAQGAPLVNDLIGLGRTPYVVQKSGEKDSKGNLTADGVFYTSLRNLSANLYRNLQVTDSDWKWITFGCTAVTAACTASDKAIIAAIKEDGVYFSGLLNSAQKDAAGGWEAIAEQIAELYVELRICGEDPGSTCHWVGVADNGLDFSNSTPEVRTKVAQLQALIEIAMAAKAKDYQRVVSYAYEGIGCGGADVTNESCQFITIADNIANAGDEQQLLDAFNATTDPAGGWRYKKTDNHLSGIGAVLGLGVGRETVWGGPVSGWTKSYGAYAPIGYTFSFANCEPHFHGTIPPWSSEDCTLMLGLLDLGGQANYLSNDPVHGGRLNTAPRSTLAGAYAPGISFYWRIGDSPFVSGIAFERTTSLRTATLTDGTQQRLDSTRFIIFWGVDLVFHQWGG